TSSSPPPSRNGQWWVRLRKSVTATARCWAAPAHFLDCPRVAVRPKEKEMKRLLLVVTIAAVSVLTTGLQAADKEPSWHFTAEYIEACSCNLFCPCFFYSRSDKDFCEFNNAIQVKRGHYGDVKLDGMKLW